ncbi:MAG: FAD-binding oxidoreductase [Proteobacteria bacterium]|nr:FAD-binding oxidoreductase [Pseudomonadota bacterium]
MNRKADIIVIGGGLIGGALAHGISSLGVKTMMLDQGDQAYRAALGNFGLVWVQGKGLGHRPYTEWCMEACSLFTEYAKILADETGIDIAYRKTGGLVICTEEDELSELKKDIHQMKSEAVGGEYDCRILDHQGIQELLPKIKLGDSVPGGSFSPYDGRVNPLLLLKAIHLGYQKKGGQYIPDQNIIDIKHKGGIYELRSSSGDLFSAPKIIVAAGLGTPKLAAMLGMEIPVRPEKGQIFVTERVQPIMDMACMGPIQTDEGTFTIGHSMENVGFDMEIKVEVMKDMAQRVIKTFPILKKLKIIRCWSALRPLAPDGMPIYEKSEEFPGAYAISTHSGVTLSSVHFKYISKWVVQDTPPIGFSSFNTKRFHVQKTA